VNTKREYTNDAKALGFFAASKGLSAWQTGRIARQADPGRDYRRCSKGLIAHHLRSRPGYVVNSVLKALREALRNDKE